MRWHQKRKDNTKNKADTFVSALFFRYRVIDAEPRLRKQTLKARVTAKVTHITALDASVFNRPSPATKNIGEHIRVPQYFLLREKLKTAALRCESDERSSLGNACDRSLCEMKGAGVGAAVKACSDEQERPQALGIANRHEVITRRSRKQAFGLFLFNLSPVGSVGASASRRCPLDTRTLPPQPKILGNTFMFHNLFYLLSADSIRRISSRFLRLYDEC